MGIVSRLKKFCFIDLRIIKYQFLSDCKRVSGKPILYFPILITGKGRVSIGKNFQNGVLNSTYFYTGYNNISSRKEDSEVIIGDDVVFSNGVSIYAETKITIEDKVLIGLNCFMIDSDGHELSPDKRTTGTPGKAEILIKRNVLIFYNVMILKGVTIGENSVIGSGSIVTKDIPANVFATGNPARVIRNL